jgi:predicted DNA binding CopG/RHH family protein
MSIPVSQKKRGRPATGQDPTITVRLPQGLIEDLNKEATKRGVSRSALIKEALERTIPRTVYVTISKG